MNQKISKINKKVESKTNTNTKSKNKDERTCLICL